MLLGSGGNSRCRMPDMEQTESPPSMAVQSPSSALTTAAKKLGVSREVSDSILHPPKPTSHAKPNLSTISANRNNLVLATFFFFLILFSFAPTRRNYDDVKTLLLNQVNEHSYTITILRDQEIKNREQIASDNQII